MRKLFLAVSIVLILASCEGEVSHLVSITNVSDFKTVSYIYNGISDTLEVSETKDYEISESYGPPRDVVDGNGIASLVTKQNNITGDFTFSDAAPLTLNVINMLPIDITIKADNFIDNNGSMELLITANTESLGALIYTKSPNFTSTTDYPIIIEKNITENEMHVIIR